MFTIKKKNKNKNTLTVKVVVNPTEKGKTPNRVDSRLILNSLDLSDLGLIVNFDPKTVKSNSLEQEVDFVFYLKEEEPEEEKKIGRRKEKATNKLLSDEQVD